PDRAYQDYARLGSLAGLRIGVVREFMDLRRYGPRDEEAVRIVDAAIGQLRGTGATIVDPGAGGALFTQCFRRYAPQAFGKLFTARHPDLFPIDETGAPTRSHIETLVELARDPGKVPD